MFKSRRRNLLLAQDELLLKQQEDFLLVQEDGLFVAQEENLFIIWKPMGASIKAQNKVK